MDSSDPQPLVYTAADAARALRCSMRTVRRMLSSGQLPSITVGKPGSLRPRRLISAAAKAFVEAARV